LVFFRRSASPPLAARVYALVEALEPLNDAAVDKDPWEILD
jgi:hypothetical protein